MSNITRRGDMNALNPYDREQTDGPHYYSYLLRMWQTRDGDEMVWRVSLESPLTGRRWGFPGLTELFAFLSAQAEETESGRDLS